MQEIIARIAGIVGFFVCEDHILNTGSGLVTRGYLSELWATTSSGIMTTLQTHSSFCTESSFMLKIKNLMILFSNTLQNFGFSADKMYALLHELRDHYTEARCSFQAGASKEPIKTVSIHILRSSCRSGS
jgi:hypothetical protein